MTCGYVISREPDSIRQAFKEGSLQKSSALMIKRERYLETIPEDIIRLCDEYDLPLISMPFSAPYMEVMNQINVAVMNRTMRRFQIQNTNIFQPSDRNYKTKKLNRILQAVEVEMKFPTMLYDLTEGRSYYSSANFRRIMESFDLTESDYCEPSRPYTKHTLCDYINMVRYRLLNPDNAEGPRISWIRIPICLNRKVRAYFVVMESREFIDHYDEFSIRIAFMMIQDVYEQLEIAKSVEDVGFENFIHSALSMDTKNNYELLYQANIRGISMNNVYIYAVFRQMNPQCSTYSERKHLTESFWQSRLSSQGKLVLLDENEGALVLETSDTEMQDKDYIFQMLKEFQEQVKKNCPEMKLQFGVCREARPLSEVKKAIEKCRKVLKIGQKLLPDCAIWDYEMLGPLTWLEIPEEELDHMLEEYRNKMREEKNVELLRTLKVYLENNMNYSLTAKKTYVHINTIRKRIDEVEALLDVKWDQPVERLKMEVLLQFLDL